MNLQDHEHVTALFEQLTLIISETNGLTLEDTLCLLATSPLAETMPEIARLIRAFHQLLHRFQHDDVNIEKLLSHPFAAALREFLRSFPLHYREEHIHLTGSLAASFIYPRLKPLLEGPDRALYEEKIAAVYGPEALPITSIEDVDNLIRLKDCERFDRYLKILYLPKLILTTREAHEAAAYHMAHELHTKYNIGGIRLKFTLFRNTTDPLEQIPGLESLTPDDVVLGLYDGFARFRAEVPRFEFILSPCFRKESNFFDAEHFASKKEHFEYQVKVIIDLLEKYPQLRDAITEVDTVGNERGYYRKIHFMEMKKGFRKLQRHGFKIRSHHGETWETLRKGIQSVDNAMNIWNIDALEHGLSLGINPNYYYHRIHQRTLKWNRLSEAIHLGSPEYRELMEMDWDGREAIRDKLLAGTKLERAERTAFTKIKFHTAIETERYQHEVLNRMIDKQVSLIALPSSNKRLTGAFEDYKDHPFSWWEKKGIKLGVGTDNYITLNTDYLREMMILLFTDADNLKITKLLIVASGETRRPYISHKLWEMRKSLSARFK